jgi:hypothetical protein
MGYYARYWSILGIFICCTLSFVEGASAKIMPVLPPGKTQIPRSLEHTFKKSEIEAMWIASGGPKDQAEIAAAIALAESGGAPKQESRNSNGSIDRGLFQINSVHGKCSTTNITENVKCAVKIYKESKGWAPWTTYKTGAYKSHLGGEKISDKEKKTAEGSAASPQQAIEEAAGNLLSFPKGFVDFFNFLGSGAGWARILKVAGGSILLIVALAELAKVGSGSQSSIKDTAQKVAIGPKI